LEALYFAIGILLSGARGALEIDGVSRGGRGRLKFATTLHRTTRDREGSATGNRKIWKCFRRKERPRSSGDI
jgi:hypothetical protein